MANGRLLREGPYDEIWIQPAAGDAGGALGAALAIWHHYLDEPREVDGIHDLQQGSFLGPGYSSEDVRELLGERPHRELPWDELLDEVVDRLVAGQVIGWFQGRMEFGPRALGARSILGDPRNPEMQQRLNLKIKLRESFRPFAPAVLADQAGEWIEHPGPSPYMLHVAPVREAKRTVPSPDAAATGLRRVQEVRSQVPAVTHLDYSARLQTVDGRYHPRFHQLLQRFFARTGCPMLVNTSFNVRGEPIVCTPADAYRCFMATGMDALVLEDVLLEKHAQPVHDRQGLQRTFALD